MNTEQVKILKYLSEGYTVKEIAKLLNISTHTVNFHLKSVYRQLGVDNRIEAVLIACKNNII